MKGDGPMVISRLYNLYWKTNTHIIHTSKHINFTKCYYVIPPHDHCCQYSRSETDVKYTVTERFRGWVGIEEELGPRCGHLSVNLEP